MQTRSLVKNMLTCPTMRYGVGLLHVGDREGKSWSDAFFVYKNFGDNNIHLMCCESFCITYLFSKNFFRTHAIYGGYFFTFSKHGPLKALGIAPLQEKHLNQNHLFMVRGIGACTMVNYLLHIAFHYVSF